MLRHLTYEVHAVLDDLHRASTPSSAAKAEASEDVVGSWERYFGRPSTVFSKGPMPLRRRSSASNTENRRVRCFPNLRERQNVKKPR